MTHRKHDHFRIHAVKRTYNKETNTFNFNITYQTTPATQTQRTREVAEAFGLGTDNTQQFTLIDNLNLKIHPTDIVLITGDSGSGKSTLLKAIKADLGTAAQDTADLRISLNTPIIETVGKNTHQALELLSKTGLNDAFLFLRNYNQLSEGQKHRYRIARLAQTGKQWWILDEFCSSLDRDTAKIVAFNLQRLARQNGKAVIAATAHSDLQTDLAPNVTIHKRFGKEITTNYHPNAQTRECSLNTQMHTQPGTLTDYKQLSQFHYRTAQCTAPKQIFTLKRGNELCGTIVYSYPPPMCFGRTKTWKGTLTQLQQEITAISRVVIHPKYRGIGLGAKLIRDTLPQAGTRCVEAVAVMAKYNPFFEHAGMQRIAESKPSNAVTNALQQLENLGFDSALLSGLSYGEHKVKDIGCEPVVAILKTLSEHDPGTRRRLASLKNVYPKHDEFTQKINQLDNAGLAKVLKRLSFMAQTKVYLFWEKP